VQSQERRPAATDIHKALAEWFPGGYARAQPDFEAALATAASGQLPWAELGADMGSVTLAAEGAPRVALRHVKLAEAPEWFKVRRSALALLMPRHKAGAQPRSPGLACPRILIMLSSVLLPSQYPLFRPGASPQELSPQELHKRVEPLLIFKSTAHPIHPAPPALPPTPPLPPRSCTSASSRC
jgi:hypothetical protein